MCKRPNFNLCGRACQTSSRQTLTKLSEEFAFHPHIITAPSDYKLVQAQDTMDRERDRDRERR